MSKLDLDRVVKDVSLKPCPFCGGKAEMFDNSRDFTADRKRYFIRCTELRCAMIIAFSGNTDKHETAKQWNKRTDRKYTMEELEL